MKYNDYLYEEDQTRRKKQREILRLRSGECQLHGNRNSIEYDEDIILKTPAANNGWPSCAGDKTKGWKDESCKVFLQMEPSGLQITGRNTGTFPADLQNWSV